MIVLSYTVVKTKDIGYNVYQINYYLGILYIVISGILYQFQNSNNNTNINNNIDMNNNTNINTNIDINNNLDINTNIHNIINSIQLTQHTIYFYKSILYSGIPLLITQFLSTIVIIICKQIGILSMINYISIIVGYLISIMRYGEQINIWVIIGFILLVFGMYRTLWGIAGNGNDNGNKMNSNDNSNSNMETQNTLHQQLTQNLDNINDMQDSIDKQYDISINKDKIMNKFSDKCLTTNTTYIGNIGNIGNTVNTVNIANTINRTNKQNNDNIK